jgi:hypothetical protein
MYNTRRQLKSLIKSGGGTGPVKPGNLLMQGAKSGGVKSEDEDERSESMPAGLRRAFLCCFLLKISI